jgi:hypothetical protein
VRWNKEREGNTRGRGRKREREELMKRENTKRERGKEMGGERK